MTTQNIPAGAEEDPLVLPSGECGCIRRQAILATVSANRHATKRAASHLLCTVEVCSVFYITLKKLILYSVPNLLIDNKWCCNT